MPILFAEISSAPNMSSTQFVDIPGLALDLPPTTQGSPHAVIILNVPSPFAEGSEFPGLDFGINVNGQVVAIGSFTYQMRQPESFARSPFTLAVRVALRDGLNTPVRAQWRSIRNSTGHIDSYACISAILTASSIPNCASEAIMSPDFHNVKFYGAAGDGTTDDTGPVRRAMNAAFNAGGGTIYFPPGQYLITDTLSFTNQLTIEVAGNGLSSNILWPGPFNLLEWPAGFSCREVTVRDLRITSTNPKGPTNTAISCQAGVERSLFERVLVCSDDLFTSSIPVNNPGTGIACVGVCDSTTIRDCLLWGIKGRGIALGHGAEIRIEGGRIIGDKTRDNGSIGIHLTGNNGGVHILTTDISGFQEGVRIDNSLGQGSNREVFMTHATIDRCFRGLGLYDSSYVSMAGCWAASCDHENIHVESGNPILVISGGTIFNAGGIMVADPAFGAHGLVVNSGSFLLTGVAIRDNKGKGVWVANANAREYTITGCRVSDNIQGLNLMGSGYLVSNNIFARNPNQFAGSNFLVNDNVIV